MSTEDSIRSIHIFSDKKFVPWTKNTFNLPHWTCYYVILNHQKKNFCEPLDDSMLEVSADAFGQKKIAALLDHQDIAFHYFLDNIKADLIAQSPNHLVHCWCFFGAEVYQQTNLFRQQLYGQETKRLLRLLPEIRFRYDLRKFYFKYILFKKPPIQSLLNAIPHVHSILWYVEEEIDFINTKLTLPLWQFFQFFSFSDIIPEGTAITNPTTKKILIGNSATVENNHADALPLLMKMKDTSYSFSLPMTYGQFDRYKTKIKQQYKNAFNDRVTFLEEHLPLKAYYQLLQEHPTAIFLHYRQQALGNILYLLYAGTKIYLSEKSVIYTWLKKNGIKVFKFEADFESHANTNQLTLDRAAMEENQKRIQHLLHHDRNTATIKALEREVVSKKHNKEQ